MISTQKLALFFLSWVLLSKGQCRFIPPQDQNEGDSNETEYKVFSVLGRPVEDETNETVTESLKTTVTVISENGTTESVYYPEVLITKFQEVLGNGEVYKTTKNNLENNPTENTENTADIVRRVLNESDNANSTNNETFVKGEDQSLQPIIDKRISVSDFFSSLQSEDVTEIVEDNATNISANSNTEIADHEENGTISSSVRDEEENDISMQSDEINDSETSNYSSEILFTRPPHKNENIWYFKDYIHVDKDSSTTEDGANVITSERGANYLDPNDSLSVLETTTEDNDSSEEPPIETFSFADHYNGSSQSSMKIGTKSPGFTSNSQAIIHLKDNTADEEEDEEEAYSTDPSMEDIFNPNAIDLETSKNSIFTHMEEPTTEGTSSSSNSPDVTPDKPSTREETYFSTFFPSFSSSTQDPLSTSESNTENSFISTESSVNEDSEFSTFIVHVDEISSKRPNSHEEMKNVEPTTEEMKFSTFMYVEDEDDIDNKTSVENMSKPTTNQDLKYSTFEKDNTETPTSSSFHPDTPTMDLGLSISTIINTNFETISQDSSNAENETHEEELTTEGTSSSPNSPDVTQDKPSTREETYFSTFYPIFSNSTQDPLSTSESNTENSFISTEPSVNEDSEFSTFIVHVDEISSNKPNSHEKRKNVEPTTEEMKFSTFMYVEDDDIENQTSVENMPKPTTNENLKYSTFEKDKTQTPTLSSFHPDTPTMDLGSSISTIINTNFETISQDPSNLENETVESSEEPETSTTMTIAYKSSEQPYLTTIMEDVPVNSSSLDDNTETSSPDPNDVPLMTTDTITNFINTLSAGNFENISKFGFEGLSNRNEVLPSTTNTNDINTTGSNNEEDFEEPSAVEDSSNEVFITRFVTPLSISDLKTPLNNLEDNSYEEPITESVTEKPTSSEGLTNDSEEEIETSSTTIDSLPDFENAQTTSSPENIVEDVEEPIIPDYSTENPKASTRHTVPYVDESTSKSKQYISSTTILAEDNEVPLTSQATMKPTSHRVTTSDYLTTPSTIQHIISQLTTSKYDTLPFNAKLGTGSLELDDNSLRIFENSFGNIVKNVEGSLHDFHHLLDCTVGLKRIIGRSKRETPAKRGVAVRISKSSENLIISLPKEDDKLQKVGLAVPFSVLKSITQNRSCDLSKTQMKDNFVIDIHKSLQDSIGLVRNILDYSIEPGALPHLNKQPLKYEPLFGKMKILIAQGSDLLLQIDPVKRTFILKPGFTTVSLRQNEGKMPSFSINSQSSLSSIRMVSAKIQKGIDYIMIMNPHLYGFTTKSPDFKEETSDTTESLTTDGTAMDLTSHKTRLLVSSHPTTYTMEVTTMPSTQKQYTTLTNEVQTRSKYSATTEKNFEAADTNENEPLSTVMSILGSPIKKTINKELTTVKSFTVDQQTETTEMPLEDELLKTQAILEFENNKETDTEMTSDPQEEVTQAPETEEPSGVSKVDKTAGYDLTTYIPKEEDEDVEVTTYDPQFLSQSTVAEFKKTLKDYKKDVLQYMKDHNIPIKKGSTLLTDVGQDQVQPEDTNEVTTSGLTPDQTTKLSTYLNLVNAQMTESNQGYPQTTLATVLPIISNENPQNDNLQISSQTHNLVPAQPNHQQEQIIPVSQTQQIPLNPQNQAPFNPLAPNTLVNHQGQQYLYNGQNYVRVRLSPFQVALGLLRNRFKLG